MIEKKNVYVGHRYVPKLYEEWDKTISYEGLSIVTYQGTSYTSKKHVPVGIDILNKEYWVVTGNYNAQVENYRQDVRRVEEELQTKTDENYVNETVNKLSEKLIAEGTNYIHVDLERVPILGESEPVYNTIQQAFDYLQSLGSKLEFGLWVIKIKGYGSLSPYDGGRISKAPFIAGRLLIEGDVDENGNPTTFIKKKSSLISGIRIEPGIQNVQLKNIEFQDFKVGFNGYGFLMKDRGYAFLENCRAINCDNGFAGINGVTIITRRTIADNCETGYRCQYSSNGTFGSGAGGALYENGGNGGIAINCVKGVYVSRSSVAHVDYMMFENNSFAGVHVDDNCRAHVLGSHFKRNDVGVLTDGSGEWLNNRDEVNNFFEGTPDANRINYDHRGVSRETRLYSQRSKNLFRQDITFGKNLSVRRLTGTTELTVMGVTPSTSYIPKHFLAYEGRKVKVVLTGKMLGEGAKHVNIYLKAINDNGSPATPEVVVGSINYNSSLPNLTTFKMEYELDTIGNGEYMRSGNTLLHLIPNNYVLSFTGNMITNYQYQVRVSGELENVDSIIEIDKIEFYLAG